MDPNNALSLSSMPFDGLKQTHSDKEVALQTTTIKLCSPAQVGLLAILPDPDMCLPTPTAPVLRDALQIQHTQKIQQGCVRGKARQAQQTDEGHKIGNHA